MKIYPIDTLAEMVPELKNDGNMVIQCHGCFDVLHIGHMQHLKAAKRLGDILIVTVTADEFVNKGPNRPIFNAWERAEMLANMQCVDFVAINPAANACEAIIALKPDIYVKGADYIGLPPDAEQMVIKKMGGKIAFTTTDKYSTTEIIKRIRNEIN